MHEETSSWRLPAVGLVAAVLACWAVLAASAAAARGFSLLLYVLANLVVFLDMFDFAVRLYFRRTYAAVAEAGYHSSTSISLDIAPYSLYQKRVHLRPFALVISVHDAEDEIDDFLEALEAYRDRVWFIDDGSTDQTCSRIRQAGWRILEGGANRKKPGAIRRILEVLPSEIETLMVLDPDVTIRNRSIGELSSLETVIFDFQRSGMAAVCPRIAIRQDGFLTRLQGLEYCMAFSLGRMSLADHGINSGISIYRRDALEFALQRHSLSVYAEDLENSAILLGKGEQIYCDARLVVETEGKRTWGGWFSQRVGWAFGLIKVYSEHFGEIRIAAKRQLSAAYQFLIYMGGFNLLLHPLKIVSLLLLSLSFAKGLDTLFGLGLIPDWDAAEPVYFLAAFAKFTLLASAAILTAVPRGERLYLVPAVPLFFFYAHAQILPATVGYANWLSWRLLGWRIWPDHYQDEESLSRQQREPVLAASTAAR